MVKDYYGILGIAPSASVDDIKKSFRLLALQYHPDKNDGDPYAQAYYNEVREAYETLINPAARHQYHQNKWLSQAQGQNLSSNTAITPLYVYNQLYQLDRELIFTDAHRMTDIKYAVQFEKILPQDTLDKLKVFFDIDETLKVPLVNKAIQIVKQLQPQVTEVAEAKTILLINGDAALTTHFKTTILQRNKKYRREKYQWVWFVLVFIALLGLLVALV
jgi:molecular chaperone DnaJ